MQLLIMSSAQHILVIIILVYKSVSVIGARNVSLKISPRIVNPIVPNDKVYPWMVYLPREMTNAKGTVISGCSGVIIRRSVILTAAHCICMHIDLVPENLESYVLCKPNESGKTPVNQLEDGINVYYVVGQKKIDEILWLSSKNQDALQKTQEFLKTCPKAIGGFVYETEVNEYGRVTLNNNEYGIDLGMLIVKIPDDLDIGTISLPTDSHLQNLDEEVIHFAGWGLAFKFGYKKEKYNPDTFEWGDQPKFTEGTFENPTVYSTCITNAYSPKESRFRYCDTIKVIENNGCHKDKYPTWDLEFEDEQICENYWAEAEDLLDNANVEIPGREQFMQAQRMKVGEKMCYKDALFKTNGWCEIATNDLGKSRFHKRRWGFCSTSCNIDFMKNPRVVEYHEAKQTSYDTQENKIKTCEWEDCPNYAKCNDYLCSLPLLPDTSTWMFSIKRKNYWNQHWPAKYSRPDKNKLVLSKDKNPLSVEENQERKFVCHGISGIGDSGGPVWIDGDGNSEVLVAIHSATEEIHSWRKSYKSKQEPKCGSSMSVKITSNAIKWINEMGVGDV